MNTQTASVERRASWWRRVLIDRLLFRPTVFLASYIVACAVATVVVDDPDMMLCGAVMIYPFMLATLPFGLFFGLDQLGLDADWLFPLPIRWLIYPIGWLIYLGVSIPAVITKKRWVFVALYIIFIILLAVSVRGCTSGGQTDFSRMG